MMNDVLRLRDHSQPCEHPLDPEGMYDGAFVCEVNGEAWWACGSCPGGREITLRHVLTWDTQDSITVDWQPGFNGKRVFVEVEE